MEQRWRNNQLWRDRRNFAQPAWAGEDLHGKTILIHAEQGYGDTIQFIRYAPLLKARGARVIAQVQVPLRTLLRDAPGVDELLTYDDTPSGFDCYLAMMSLPRFLGPEPAEVPFADGYLRVPDAAHARWAARVGNAPGLRVGLIWAGNPTHRNDRNRSAPLEKLRPLFDAPGVSWFSLQVGLAEAALHDLPPGAVDNLVPDIGDFADTAAALSALDLLVAVDTSCAHLAGALGRPVWLMLPTANDWRWMERFETTPWYSRMRLFRQAAYGDWAGVVERIGAALADPAVRGDLSAAHPPVPGGQLA